MALLGRYQGIVRRLIEKAVDLRGVDDLHLAQPPSTGWLGIDQTGLSGELVIHCGFGAADWPVCGTSNNPAAARVWRCSLMMPEGYRTGRA